MYHLSEIINEISDTISGGHLGDYAIASIDFKENIYKQLETSTDTLYSEIARKLMDSSTFNINMSFMECREEMNNLAKVMAFNIDKIVIHIHNTYGSDVNNDIIKNIASMIKLEMTT